MACKIACKIHYTLKLVTVKSFNYFKLFRKVAAKIDNHKKLKCNNLYNNLCNTDGIDAVMDLGVRLKSPLFHVRKYKRTYICTDNKTQKLANIQNKALYLLKDCTNHIPSSFSLLQLRAVWLLYFGPFETILSDLIINIIYMVLVVHKN